MALRNHYVTYTNTWKLNNRHCITLDMRLRVDYHATISEKQTVFSTLIQEVRSSIHGFHTTINHGSSRIVRHRNTAFV